MLLRFLIAAKKQLMEHGARMLLWISAIAITEKFLLHAKLHLTASLGLVLTARKEYAWRIPLKKYAKTLMVMEISLMEEYGLKALQMKYLSAS